MAAYLLTYSPPHLLTDVPTHLLAYLLTELIPYLPTCLLVYLLADLPYLPTYLTCLCTYSLFRKHGNNGPQLCLIYVINANYRMIQADMLH